MPLQKQAAQLPMSIAITQWAIAGGVVGWPVHVVFQDFPEPVVGEVFRRYAAAIGNESILRVHEPRHLRQLEVLPEQTRLIMLFDSRLFARCSWLLEMHSTAGSGKLSPTPALFAFQSRR